MDVYLDRSQSAAGIPAIVLSRELCSCDSEQLLQEIAQLHEAGISSVSIRRQQVARIGQEKLSYLLEDAGITVSSLGYCGGFTGTLERTFDEAMLDTARAVDEALQLKARSLIILPGARGNHTWKHSLKSVRIGLQGAISHAGAAQLQFLVPTESLLGRSQDGLTVPGDVAEWLDQNTSSRVQSLIVVRGRGSRRQLPANWQRSLLSGASLRICSRSETYVWNRRLLGKMVSALSAGQQPGRSANPDFTNNQAWAASTSENAR